MLGSNSIHGTEYPVKLFCGTGQRGGGGGCHLL